MSYPFSFAAGFIATLVFHQGLFALLHLAGIAPAPYDMSATAPLGVPKVISLSFWGGVWGLPVWALIRHARGAAYWWRSVVIGALGPSAVALFVVFPLKGMAVAGGWDPKIIAGALMLNGAWGFGVALLMRLMRQGPAAGTANA